MDDCGQVFVLSKMIGIRLMRSQLFKYSVLTIIIILVLLLAPQSEKVGTPVLEGSDLRQLNEPKRKTLSYPNSLSASFTFMYGTTAVKVKGSIPTNCTLLFIGIHSGPSMTERRQALRETYLTQKTDGVVHTFILGNPTPALLSENALHQDMVFINQTERYTALDSVLPYKASTIIQLASRMDPQPPWLLKTDDDSYVNLPEVLKKVPTLNENKYYGRCLFRARAIRKKTSKWYVSEMFWPGNKTYPPFCVGTGYFMSQKAYSCAANIFTRPSHKYFPREDVLNGIFMKSCNIRATALPGIYADPSPKHNFLIQHHIKTAKQMHSIWRRVHIYKTVNKGPNNKMLKFANS